MLVELFSTPLIATIFGLLHIVGIFAAVHAVMTVRTSQGAIAWALSLVMMPWLTLLPYAVLGSAYFTGYTNPQRFRNEVARLQARGIDPGWAQRHPEYVAAYPDDSGLQALPRLTDTPLLRGNHVRLLINGEATYDTLLAAIRTARQAILVQFFAIADDAAGRALHAALAERARAGVVVQFLFDGIGCHALSKDYVTTLAAAGAQVHEFATRRLANRFQLNFRNHRKLLIVDGEVGFVGGHNIGDMYLGARAPLSPWRDTHIELRGPVLGTLQLVFAEDWFWATRQLPQMLAPVTSDGKMLCQALPSGPADAQETCSLFFVTAINAARTRIWLASPYFVPDEAVMSAMQLAVMRGVDVRVLIPTRPDHHVVFQASTLFAHDAVQSGVRIFRYTPGFMHQKVVLIDDRAAAVGSANLDNRSFRLNFELMVMTLDTGFASQVEAMLEADFAQAREVGLDEYRSTPYWRRALMHIAHLFAPIL